VNGFVNLEQRESSKEFFAVKYFQAGSDFDRRLLRREMDILVGLKHPCIVSITGWSPPLGRSGRCRVITEAFENGSIADEPRSWSHTNISILLMGIVMGMRYLHSKGVVHGDLKPSNCFIGYDRRVRIGDLACSRFEECGAIKFKSDHHGQYMYTAPEVYEGEAPSQKADVFAFGVMLYEILTGRTVFPRDASILQMARLHAAEKRPVIPGVVHPVVGKIIRGCWAAEPGNRPSFERVFRSLCDHWYPFFRDVNVRVVDGYVEEVSAEEEEAQ
jgi:serine/threonine-protein kinase